VDKAIKAAVAGGGKGLKVTVKSKIKVKPTSQGRSISGKR
jgi:hypothetical protein